MPRILISWVAMNNDFQKNSVAIDGPNFRFHEFFFDMKYTKHVILTTENETKEYSKGLILYSELKKNFTNHHIELVYTNIPQSEVINFNLLHSQIFAILTKYKDFEIDIFVSPGTATMQVVWHYIHLERKFKTKLLQTVKPEDLNSDKPRLIEIDILPAPISEYLIVNENTEFNIKKEKNTEYLITPALLEVYNKALSIAQSNRTPVLIQGETGTGKEHFADYIHRESNRKTKPLVKINCGSLSPELLESRLFGYVKGAFTGAMENKDGFFHAANGGTIFLDEIGEINQAMQVALLRILQEGEIYRVGSTVAEKINVRIISATNRDLYEECQKGNFRWDLYYRLCVAEITVPSLRERGSRDIKKLIDFFNLKICKELLLHKDVIEFTENTMNILLKHPWPGNVRELKNFIESCYAYGYKVVEPKDLHKNFSRTNIFSQLLEDVVHRHVSKVVNQCGGNLSMAKDILGIGSVNTVKKYLNLNGN